MEAMSPDFEGRLLKVLLCQGVPDRVPMIELAIYSEAKERFLGRPIQGLGDEAEFWAMAGYDTFFFTSGLREITDYAIQDPNKWGRYKPSASQTEAARLARDYASTKLRSQSLTGQANKDKRGWAASKEGMIASQKDFDEFPWPQPIDMDLSVFEEAPSVLPPGMRIIPLSGQVISVVYLMMGFETFFMKMALKDPLIDSMFQRVGEFSLGMIEILLDYNCVGAIAINDDLAGTTNVLINPKHYRRFLFPWYERIARRVHARNLPLIFHSDGNLYPILEDLVKIGFDALHPIDPKAMDIQRVREIIGPSVCLIGNVDLTFPLSTGRSEDVDASVRELIHTMAPHGGYCVSSGNTIPDYIPYENWLALRNATLKYGVYPIQV
jgi:uroporphyrinogen decarboxylase